MAKTPGDPTAGGLWLRQKPHILLQQSGAETFLYDAAGDALHVLNSTALALWELCDGEHTPDDMIAHLRARFAGTAGCDVAADVAGALRVFETENLVGEAGAQAG